MELAGEAGFCFLLLSFQSDGKYAVRTRRALIHRRGADLPDEVAHHKQVDSFLLIGTSVLGEVFGVDVAEFVLLEKYFVPLFDGLVNMFFIQ